MNKIGIVTVLYNSEKVLQEFFETLDKQTFKDFKLYVVDNASPDNSLEEVERLAKTVSFDTEIIAEKENWGVAKGNNIGIKRALEEGCEYILLSNNDLVFNHDDTVEVMIKKMYDNKNIHILTPKIYRYQDPNAIWFAGGDFNKYKTGCIHYDRDKQDVGQFEIEKKINYGPTCFCLIRKEVFDKIGLMDEWYFVYYDDGDFMYRALINGLNYYYTPSTSILHNESYCTGKGSPFKFYYQARNQLYFINKFQNKKILLRTIGYRYAALFLKHCWKNDKKLWKAELKGLNDGIKKILRRGKD